MTKAELYLIWSLNAQIKEQLSKIRSLEDCLGTRATKLDGMPKSPNIGTEHMANLVAMKVDGERRLDELLVEREKAVDKLTADIFAMNLPTVETEILLARYVTCLPFNLIASTKNFSARSVYRIHKKALGKI